MKMVFRLSLSASHRRAFAVALLLFSFAHVVIAQGEGANPLLDQDGAAEQTQETSGGVGLLRRLNLTPAQIGQIRQIRRQSEPKGRALVQRRNLAQRALNEAIYQDQADEALVRQRANELAEAQAAVTRMRAQVEWKIRSVLNPVQLQTLREIRQHARRQRREIRRENRNRQADAIDTLTQPPHATGNKNNLPRRAPLRALRRRGMLKP